jgi:hypothetical protein
MVLPFGMRMVIAFVVGRLLMTGASIVPKLAVQPVLAMARWLIDCVDGSVVGGPKAVDEADDNNSKPVGEDE